MKKLFWYIVPTTVIVLTLAGISLSNVSQQQEVGQALTFSKFTLRIASTKEDFVQLEPIPIILNLANETNQPILGHTALDFSYHHVKLFILQDGGERREIQNLSPLMKRVRIEPRKIAPGENHQATQLLNVDLDKIFPEPGSYQIQAVLQDIDNKQEIHSNLITIRITSPNDLNLQAFEYIRNSENPSYFFTGVSFTDSEQERKVIEDFVSKFGGSVYGDYATFLLGELYFSRKEYQKASEQFNKVAKNVNFVFAGKASEFIVRIKAKSACSKCSP